jgi:hypothetical protein
MKKRLSNHTKLVLTLGALCATLAIGPSAGCQSDAAELCDLACECVPCNDREEDECVITQEADAERAANYECEPEYESWVECALQNNSCDEGDNEFEIDEDCNDDRADYEECVRDNSDLGNTGPGAQGPGGSTTTTTSAGGAGAGGAGGSCATCAQYLLDSTGTVMLGDVCGSATGCGAGSSCDLVSAVGACTCEACVADCELSCFGTGSDLSTCQTCAQTNCSAETNACLSDPGTG